MKTSRLRRVVGFFSVVALSAGCGSSSTANKATAHLGTGGSGDVDPGGSGGARDPGAPGISISPSSAHASFGGSVQFRAVVTGFADQTVTWSVKEGASGGTVDASGLYTAPSTSGTFHVIAATADGSKNDTATVSVSAPQGTPPTLTPGTWTEITPPGLGLTCCTTYGVATVTIDPSDPNTLYATADQKGLFRSTDRGSNWTLLGEGETPGDTTTSFLDSPIRVAVDPSDPKHLYATQGVRGQTLGFWVSHDGGATWTLPKGFLDATKTTGTRDVTAFSVDPADFKHVIIASHTAWTGLTNSGILETKDGGDTVVLHQPQGSWSAGTMEVQILSAPALGLGDGNTWLVGTDGDGFWRTTDAGANWKQVFATAGIPHGGADIYYTKDKVLYAGAAQYPIRSKDNGATFEQLQGGLSYWYYYSVYGDGTTLYTQISYTGSNSGDANFKLSPFMTSPESDGSKWTPYKGGAQTFSDGPYVMRFDPVNHIMYAACWDAGLWALKVE